MSLKALKVYVAVLALIASVGVLGVAIFYGMVALARGGNLDFFADNIWAIALVFAVIVLGWSSVILFLGNKVDQQVIDSEQGGSK